MLDFLCIFDWIHPLLAWMQDLIYGKPYTYMIYEGQGWSWREVASMLRSHSIRAWGPMYLGRTMLLSVRYSQREQAQVLLDQHRIQVANPVGQDERRGLLRRLMGR